MPLTPADPINHNRPQQPLQPLNTSPSTPQGDAELRASIASDLMDKLYSFIPTGVAAHIMLATVMTVTLWDKNDHLILGAWLAARIAYAFTQPILYRAYKKHKHRYQNAYRWGVYHALLAIPSGILWGLPAILFMDPSVPLNTIVIMAILVSLGMGATAADAAFPPVFYAFNLPIQSLLMVGIVIKELPSAPGLALLVLLGLTLSVNYTRVFHHALESSARLRFQNIQLRREAEEKSGLLESTLENMDQGIAVVDADNHIRMWNRHFQQLLDIGVEKYPDLLEKGAELQRVLNQVQPPLPDLTARHTEYHGHDRVVEIRRTQAPHGDRVFTFTDISGRKQRESALETARREAEQANAAKTRFLAAASHDLRQPIHALGLFFSALSEQVNTSRTAPILDKIDTTIGIIASMLNALLDISKLDAGLVHPNPTAVDLNAIFLHLESEFSVEMAQTGGSLRVRHCEHQVYSDPEMLERMLRNIVANAVRYAAGEQILIAARRRNGLIHCQVYDTGPGIPEEKSRDIFLEFQQLANPQRDRSEGLGLGLAIVDRLAKLLDHPVLLRSTLGRGSRFSIVVPLNHCDDSARQVDPEASTRPSAELLHGLVVLVLDDEIIVREAMRMLLNGWGCEVLAADGIDDALQQVKTVTPQVMLVDYRLPGNRTGNDAIIALHQAIGTPVPAAIITGDTAPDRLLEANAASYPVLHKPVQPAKLRATLGLLIGDQPPDA